MNQYVIEGTSQYASKPFGITSVKNVLNDTFNQGCDMVMLSGHNKGYVPRLSTFTLLIFIYFPILIIYSIPLANR